MISRCTLPALLLAASALVAGGPAHAEIDADQRAAQLYQHGIKLLQDRRPEEALRALDASLALRPSPNTQLVRAHALRLLGRKVLAITAYEEVVTEAGERVRGGDDRMKSTLADAGRWIAVLRADLGELTIEIGSASDATRVAVDGASVAGKRGADGTLRARVWREPGKATVTAEDPSAGARSSSAEITAGSSAMVRLDLGKGPAPEAAPSKLPPVGTWITWTLGVAGGVTFGIFGARARSASSDLEACSPRCPASLASMASTGKRDAAVANVALGVGIAGLLTGAVVWIVSARSSSTTSRPTASISVGPDRAGIDLQGRF